jgi:hypothetical protein
MWLINFPADQRRLDSQINADYFKSKQMCFSGGITGIYSKN